MEATCAPLSVPAERLRGEEWHPHRDPAPDVVGEIDISRSGISKFAMFARSGG